jgi:hypothetical protein
MIGGRGAVIGRREIFRRVRAEGRIGPERKLEACVRHVALWGWLHYARLLCPACVRRNMVKDPATVTWHGGRLGLWRVGSGVDEGVFQQKSPFVAGVGVPESLGHLLSRLGRLAPKASVARGIAWWWGFPPVALDCGKVAPGCELEVVCADLLRLKFEREGTGNGWGLGRRGSGCGAGGCCALRSYFLRCLVHATMRRELGSSKKER